jgi:hypothetical protein
MNAPCDGDMSVRLFWAVCSHCAPNDPKLSHRRLATGNATAKLTAPTAVGSGDLLGNWVICLAFCLA